MFSANAPLSSDTGCSPEMIPEKDSKGSVIANSYILKIKKGDVYSGSFSINAVKGYNMIVSDVAMSSKGNSEVKMIKPDLYYHTLDIPAGQTDSIKFQIKGGDSGVITISIHAKHVSVSNKKESPCDSTIKIQVQAKDCVPSQPLIEKVGFGEACGRFLKGDQIIYKICGDCYVCQSSGWSISTALQQNVFQMDTNQLLNTNQPLLFEAFKIASSVKSLCYVGYHGQACTISGTSSTAAETGMCKIESSKDVSCAKTCNSDNDCPYQFYGMVCGSEIGDSQNKDKVFRLRVDYKCVNQICVSKISDKTLMKDCSGKKAGGCIPGIPLIKDDTLQKNRDKNSLFQKRQTTANCKNNPAV